MGQKWKEEKMKRMPVRSCVLHGKPVVFCLDCVRRQRNDEIELVKNGLIEVFERKKYMFTNDQVITIIKHHCNIWSGKERARHK